MIKLTDKQLQAKVAFINQYLDQNSNAATASKMDANANVTQKNIVTLRGELYKDFEIQTNRYMMYQEITQLFGEELAKEYIRQLEQHELYRHDETKNLYPYCCSIDLFPMVTKGMSLLGGEAKAPKHLESFCGSFINTVLAVSGQNAGACLHHSQIIIIRNKKTKETKGIPIREFVSQFGLEEEMHNLEQNEKWEMSIVSDYEVWEHKRFVDIKKVFRRKYKNKDIYHIKTKSGKEIKCSEDHKFKVFHRESFLEVPAEELLVGNTVMNTMEEFEILENEDYHEGQLVGIVAGDGCITADNSLRISINYDRKEIIEKCQFLLKKFFNREGHLDNGNSCYDLRLHSKEAVAKIRKYFINGYTTYDKHIDVSKYSLEFLAGFLDGIMATDGRFKQTHSLALANLKLIQNIQEILVKFGYHRNIKIYDDKRETRKRNYVIHFPTILNKYLKLTSIRRQDTIGFNEQNTNEIKYVGTTPFKNSRGKKNKPLTRTGRNLDWTPDAIDDINIIKNDDGYVYELETASGWYSAGGILTHNCATVQFLPYFHYFAKKDHGKDYIQTHRQDVIDKFQHVVYTLNQPHTARDGQAAFWNISFVDSNYFYGLFGDMVYPDFSKPTWSEFKKLQKLFMEWIREEREKEILTFPVMTCALLTDKTTVMDKEFMGLCCDELSKGNSFFVYLSDSVDSLSSCCRLRNEIDRNEFSFTLGAGGIKTGSIGVMTINYNRMIQDGRKIEDELPKIHKYHVAYRNIIKRMIRAGMLPIYDVGLIDLDSQYSTIGINGMVEAAEYLGHEISAFSEPYKDFLKSELQKIYELNKIANKEYGCKFNTEFVPAENLGVKNCDWDRKDGYVVPADRICYNSYFYRPEDDMNIVDKFILHGDDIIQYLDGGSALHLNLKEHLDSEQYEKLFHIACTQGCNYWTVNIMRTYCETCGYNDPHTRTECIKCGSNDISYITRIIGYHKKIKNFHEKRQLEANKRHYHE